MPPLKPTPARAKILGFRALARQIDAARRRGERVVFTNGCFDLLHRGHLRSLEQARRLGDRLVVAVNGDASVRRLKGPGRPLRTAARRMELLAGLACVDWVVRFDADTPIRLIERLRPDVLAKGGDWSLERIVGAKEVRSRGGRVVRLARLAGEGTTDELARIRRSARPRVRERKTRARAPAGTRDRAGRRSDP